MHDLHDAVQSLNYLNTCPGLLEFRVTGNSRLEASHRLLTLQDFIERYKTIQGTERTLAEKYKWQLIKKNLDRWQQYEQGSLSFQEYFLETEYHNLIYPMCRAVMNDVAKQYPAALEQLFVDLFDERNDLQERVSSFKQRFDQVYMGLPSAGKNTYMDQRTISLLLTFRYPDRYTLYKDSFYSPVCKALGIERPSQNERLLHYYSIVDQLVGVLNDHPEVVTERDAMLDESCYPDPGNRILAQDIFYTTTLADEGSRDEEEKAELSEERFLKTLRRLPPEVQANFFGDVLDLLTELGVEPGDQRVAFSVRRRWLALTIGQRYCFNLGTRLGEKFGFIVPERRVLTDVRFGEFSGRGDPFYGHTDNYARVKEFWREIVQASRAELERTGQSSYRNKSNEFFEKAVFDEHYRNSILSNGSQATPKPIPMSHSLNTILYGPPGTGKTYHAITHAVAIIEGVTVEEVKKRERKLVRQRYEELYKANFIRTVTFHQSFTYEDFVEGIKPATHTSKNGEEEIKLVTYDVQDGIFKQMCVSARSGEQTGGEHIDPAILEKADFYKVSLGQYSDPADDEIYRYCLDKGVIAVGYGGSVDVRGANDEASIRRILKNAGYTAEESLAYTVRVLRDMHLGMKTGDIVFVSAGNSIVRAIGRVSGEYFMDENAPIRYKQFRRVQWLQKDVEISVEDLYPKSFVQGTLYGLDKNLVKKDYFKPKTDAKSNKHGNYVLLIDEINRGNVASIFGELITLIEDDKREGGDEPATIRLPYSKKDFSVPGNLYLLGTMNTADRSVEALDTALRRRFSFVEMPSVPAEIKPIEVEGVRLDLMLETMNDRIDQLLDRDHHIGHSYFMRLKDGAALKQVFANKVMPLLMEYFHGDAQKVGAVLGKAFVQSHKNGVKLAEGFDLDQYRKEERYTLNDPMKFTDLEPFKAIYNHAEAAVRIRASEVEAG